MTELIINEENFSEYFFNVRDHRPQPGQIMAKFTAIAELIDGQPKRDLIKALQTGKAQQAAQVMKRIYCAREPDCYRVCRQMCEDLLSGMSVEQVAEKPYEFVFESLYYTRRQYLPAGDPHWTAIPLMTYDQESNTFKTHMEI